MKQYVLGTDFGTLSARSVLVDIATGAVEAEAVWNYSHGVMDETLPCGRTLPVNFALQHPADYTEALQKTIPAVLEKAGASPEAVLGMGIDFTACTLIPLDEKGSPLCFSEKYEANPHAYVKLWKHHAAQKEADEINALAASRGETWLSSYGGKISCEWALPKILQILREDPALYADTARFSEAADWLSFVLTGTESHSSAFAGYKALWNAEAGYPSNEFFEALDPGLSGIVGTKLSERILGMGEAAGVLNEQGAALTGLLPGTCVAVPAIDAHAAMPALNLTEEGDLMVIVGTSACHLVNGSKGVPVAGTCGYVKGGVIPGTYTFEAGQAGVGDIFDWFVRNGVPGEYRQQAEAAGKNLHALLREKAEALRPGQSGLLALDWLSGNRSTLVDSDLTGMILGMTLQTKPEEIYRAWIESTAYGLRMIVEQYEKSGIPVRSICAAGGIALKDPMMMQIYADVLHRPIDISGSTQAGALGSAIYASVACGAYPDVVSAARVLSAPRVKTYLPKEENGAIYDRIYKEYAALYEYFGRENPVMKVLGEIKRSCAE